MSLINRVKNLLKAQNIRIEEGEPPMSREEVEAILNEEMNAKTELRFQELEKEASIAAKKQEEDDKITAKAQKLRYDAEMRRDFLSSKSSQQIVIVPTLVNMQASIDELIFSNQVTPELIDLQSSIDELLRTTESQPKPKRDRKSVV